MPRSGDFKLGHLPHMALLWWKQRQAQDQIINCQHILPFFTTSSLHLLFYKRHPQFPSHSCKAQHAQVLLLRSNLPSKGHWPICHDHFTFWCNSALDGPEIWRQSGQFFNQANLIDILSECNIRVFNFPYH